MSFLKSLGPKDDLLASRVLCVWPELLARDVEAQLRPVVNYLMSLGLEVCISTAHLLLVRVQATLCQHGPFCNTAATVQVLCRMREGVHEGGWCTRACYWARFLAWAPIIGVPVPAAEPVSVLELFSRACACDRASARVLVQVADVGRVVVLWPEVLLKSVEGHLQPWVGYLRGLGCTTSQVADVVGAGEGRTWMGYMGRIFGGSKPKLLHCIGQWPCAC